MTELDPETIEPRPGEALDLIRLLPWLRERLAGLNGTVSLRQFGGGKANLTYLLSGEDGTAFVLRRPPLGPVAASAHDVAREHRVLADLWRVFPLAPRSLLLCQDESVIGAPFQIMERRRGVVLRGDRESRLLADAAMAERVAAMLIDVLAELHLVDPTAAKLGDLGRPDGFMARQVEGWTRRWRAALDAAAADADDLISWIERKRPATRRSGLAHNDYKLDNLLVSADDPATAVALLDWDMCTRGDVLSDLGTLLNYCVTGDDPETHRLAMGHGEDHPGYPKRSKLIERYGARTGFDLQDLDWYRVFAAFRTAVILQQIYIRWLRGQTRDPRFAQLARRVPALIGMANDLRAGHDP